jgi:membrane-associated phospholipid phosphatase
MLEILQNIDTQVFYFLNHNLANPLFDKFFPFITEVKHWILVYIFSIFLLIFYGGRTGRIFALALILTIIASDQLSSNFLKGLFDRIRPCHTLEDVRLLINCGPGKSFPSSHAVNNFAAAAVMFVFYRKYAIWGFVMAFLMAFSRVYVGVHYPLDVLAGSIIGFAVGYAIAYALYTLSNKKLKKS